MRFEIEGDLFCPYCRKDFYHSVLVPNKAWQPGGAYWEEEADCTNCGKQVDFEGKIESSIETM